MKDVYYFQHDSNARNDPKLLALRSVYKWEGVGLYWSIIEILREQSDFKLPLNKFTFDTLVMQTQCKRSRLEKLIYDCINEFIDHRGRGLFESDGSCFWSNRLLEDMQKYQDKREKAKASAEIGWEKRRSERNANA